MQYTLHTVNDVLVAEIQKPCVGEAWTPCMHDEIKGLLGEGIRKFAIDMRGCRFINSNGIGALLAILTSVRGADGRLCLCELNERVAAAFAVTGVSALLEIHASREAALEALRGEPSGPAAPARAARAGRVPPA